MSDSTPRSRPVQLFGTSTHNHAPTVAWNVSDFKAVDDRVRGGSSQSKVEIAQGPGQGQLNFSGFLDTTTLGGAGFASQQHFTDPAFPITLPAHRFSGLSLRVRPANSNTASGNTTQKQPGGGKGPVTLYNLNLYTSRPDQRSDGRNASSIVYEADFNITQPTAIYESDPESNADEKRCAPYRIVPADATSSSPSLVSFDLAWDAFKPTYRGRPAQDAPPLDPQKIALWSLMARSNFSQQSGPFELQLDSIWAIPSGIDAVDASHVHARGSKSWEDAFQPAQLTGAPGFALYLFATIAFLLWICWALTPDAVLNRMRIQWYPDREWAFLLPSYSLLLVLLAYVVYMAINLRMTPDLTHLSTVVDPHSNPVPLKRADEMTYNEAVQYYRTEHPYGPRLSASSTDRDRHVRDLPM